MTIKVAINGFGRIGRLVARAALKNNSDIEIVSINDITDAKTLAHLFKYDSVHGKWNGDVSAKTMEKTAEGQVGELMVNGKAIKITATRNPGELPHKAWGVDVAVECTGLFTDCSKDPSARSHLTAGAKRVIVSAPAKKVDATVVIGVNDHILNADSKVISNASCTTNCLAPVAKILHDAYRIRRGLMTTIHSYTNDQNILDLPHKDLRRARAAAMSQIPSSTGAASAIGLVIPELSGKLDGFAVRVPTPNVSCVDLVVELEKSVSGVEEINNLMKSKANGNDTLARVFNYNDEEPVSVDFIGDPASATFDPGQTRVIEGNFVKVFAWYDNEWGYSNRVVDLIPMVARL